jgi:hypothetical protein
VVRAHLSDVTEDLSRGFTAVTASAALASLRDLFVAAV